MNIVICGLVLITYIVNCVAAEQRTVDSNVGKITGDIRTVKIGPNTADITTFLGIPYAEPPVGNLRFRKPMKKAKFDNTFVASEYGASCTQVHEMYTPDKMDEDCLFLNIYTPDITESDTKYPVMIFIHGGGFVFGDGKSMNGEKLTAYGKLVTVSINYRLGPLGFLNTGDDAVDTNNGLRDQHLAIKWVKDNIESFGGDSNSITIFGESAGSVCVMYQTIYPENEGLFQRAIAESGSANSFWAVTRNPKEKSISLAEILGCPETSSSKAVVQCLRDFKNTTHIALVSNVTGGGFECWGPSLDDDFVIKDRIDALDHPTAQQNLIPFKHLDLLMGTTDYDGVVFLLFGEVATYFTELESASTVDEIQQANKKMISSVLKNVFGKDLALELLDAVIFLYSNYEDPSDELLHKKQIADFATDVAFFVSTATALEKHAYQNTGSKTYQYEFCDRHDFQSKDPWIKGALHGDELLYVLGMPEELGFYYEITDEQFTAKWPLATMMMDYWTNFAKTGDPNSPRKPPVEWREYTSSDKNYLYITSDDIANRKHLNARRTAFWTSYVPKLIKNTGGNHWSHKN
ncbi:neuroligin-4, Y-linked-like [Patella vulgata]|uniref:neuroligin-4, Y-linked-like n=1 Tax=Patella vulgata TaxID=6465 RepID=UPI0024A7BE20|nr:neuroligin-4, Y-linked-like [Patella vulgata]